MKIIFLNVLDAELSQPLTDFILKHRETTDIFCFQECYVRMRTLIPELFAGFTELSATKPTAEDAFTNVTLVRDNLSILQSDSTAGTPDIGLALFTTISYKDTTLHLANMHGLSRPGKLDTPERIVQSQEILDTIAAFDGLHIMGGDLNVLPATKSVGMFEEAGYRNLIKDFDIKTTRNEIAWRNHPGNELMFSDYVFTKGVEVMSFEVPNEIVSDHQPMILTIA